MLLLLLLFIFFGALPCTELAHCRGVKTKRNGKKEEAKIKPKQIPGVSIAANKEDTQNIKKEKKIFWRKSVQLNQA